MKKMILPIFLAALFLFPVTADADRKSGHNERPRTEHRTSGHGNAGNNRGGNNNRGHKNDHRKNDHDKKGHNNKYNKHDNYKPGGNSQNRPGGNHHKPKGPKPGNNPVHRPWGHGSSVSAPGHHAGYANRHHPPRLGPMVKHCVGRGRYDHVWMVGPGQYAVRFFRNGHYYMQYIWPETGRYGSPFRIVMASPGEWYAYNNRNQWYYEDGNSLRISLNGSPLSPWTLIPSVELNINL